METEEMSAASSTNESKLKVLEATYSKVKEEVDRLSDELNESVESTGAASDESIILLDKLGKAETLLGKYEKTIEKQKKAMDDATESTSEFAETLEDVAEQAESAADELGNVGKSSGGLDGLADKLTSAVFKGNLMSGAADKLWDGVKKVASAVWNMDEATEEYRVAQGKLNTAFEAAGYSTDVAQQSYRAFYAILGDTDTATEASQLLAQLGTNVQDFSTWADIAAGVNGTFGDSLPIEGLIEAANETAKVGQVTGVLADALNWVGISEDDFNQKLAQCATTEERTALITDTLSAAYSEATAIFKENNEVIIKARENQARLQEAQGKLGEATSRLKTALSSGLAPAMEKIYGWAEKLVGKIADVAEEWAQTTNDIARPLKTDNIEEAREQIETWKQELREVNEALLMMGDTGCVELSERQSLLNAQIKNGEEQLAEWEAQTESATEATEKAAEATDKMTLSAAGVTLELKNSNLTMEEASDRFYSYAEAATNAFSQISTESELTYEAMVANLNHNAEATREFGDNMAQIASVIPKEMADMFAAGGAEMYAGVVKMLAEANAGADQGLTQLNEAYARGGTAAAEAFMETMNGSVTVETENPATISAKAMDSDVSAEQAARSVVQRTATAFISSVNSAGFDSAGRAAMNKFISGMNSMSGAVMGAANSIAQQAVNAINSALANAAAYASSVAAGYGGSYRAGGLDYVPYNGYPSVLHRGEAVLTAGEADDWRRGRSSGGNTSGITIIQNIEAVPQTPAEFAATTAAYFEQARWAI